MCRPQFTLKTLLWLMLCLALFLGGISLRRASDRAALKRMQERLVDSKLQTYRWINEAKRLRDQLPQSQPNPRDTTTSPKRTAKSGF
jgi:hypothetical protein